MKLTHWVLKIPYDILNLGSNGIVTVLHWAIYCMYMHQQTESSLVQTMICHLFSTKPFPKLMLIFPFFGHYETNLSENLMKMKISCKYFYLHKMHFQLLSTKYLPLCSDLDVLNCSMGLLPDTQNCGLRMRRECWERFPPPQWFSNPDMHHGTCVTHVPWCMPGLLTSGFLWSRCQGKRSRRMRNPRFCVSGKRSIGLWTHLYPGALRWTYLQEPPSQWCSLW